MNPDDKIYDASKRHCWPRDKISDVYEAGFYNGAKYQEDEIKALLEIVKMQRRALEVSTTSTCIGNHFVFRCICARCKALDATEQLMKDLGLGV